MFLLVIQNLVHSWLLFFSCTILCFLFCVLKILDCFSKLFSFLKNLFSFITLPHLYKSPLSLFIHIRYSLNFICLLKSPLGPSWPPYSELVIECALSLPHPGDSICLHLKFHLLFPWCHVLSFLISSIVFGGTQSPVSYWERMCVK